MSDDPKSAPWEPNEVYGRLAIRRGPSSRTANGEGGSDDGAAAQMAKNRRTTDRRTVRTASMTKMASTGGSGGGSSDIAFATGRPRDPFFYWRQNNVPFDIWKEDDLKALRAFCRLVYLSHPILASCIDIFAKYPLTGMEFQCKDSALTEFYTDLMFNQLGYEEYLPDVGREYWSVGEAWPFGSFNETIGVWEDDELLDANDIKVVRSPFLREPRFEMRLPAEIRLILEKREPKWEYTRLVNEYPEFLRMLHDEDHMPVSNVLLKQIRFKAHSFHPRGIPILLRAFRTIMQEEMLNTAMDAIADRLYTPLILAKLGASAADLGTSQPWVPDEGDLSDFEESLDAALAADFRVLIHHFAVDMQSVFGRENMPQLGADFERITDSYLQVFGLSRSMLQGGSAGVTYASDSLNRDLVTQLLGQYQKLIRRFTRDRMLVVAEAQEHYDFETRNGVRYPIMEEVLEVDEETGEKRIVEQPKLLVPDMKFKSMNLQDEAAFQGFVATLIEQGVPISTKTQLINVPIDLHEEMEAKRQEAVELAVWQIEVERDTYFALVARGFPVSDELKAKYQPMAADVDQAVATEQAMQGQELAAGASDALSAEQGDQVKGEGTDGPPDSGGSLIELPRNRIRSRPPESDEQRGRMPKPAAALMTDMTDQEVMELDDEDLQRGLVRGGLSGGPVHIGMRREAGLDRDTPLAERDAEPHEDAS